LAGSDRAVPPAIAALHSEDWDFAEVRADEAVHGLHPYPAKFLAQIPRRFIEALTTPDSLVLDPFMGGGTTAVEALAAGRRFHGVDANPLARLIAKVKTTPLSPASEAACTRVVETLDSRTAHDPPGDAWRPLIPNLHKWYSPDIYYLLVSLRTIILEVDDADARDLLLLTFANVAARASYQDSETRYVSRPRPVARDAVLAAYRAEVCRAVTLTRSLSYSTPTMATLVEGDARDASAYPNDVRLVITSPPYPNSYDYHLYHRFRLFWLGPGPSDLRKREIGSHLKHQGEVDPAGSYRGDMMEVLGNIQASLAPGAFVVFVVGEGIYKGIPFDTASELDSLAARLGFEVLPRIERRLPTNRRSVTAGRRLSTESILIWQHSRPTGISTVEPNYKLALYESSLREREINALLATHQRNQPIGAASHPSGDTSAFVRRAALSHAVDGAAGLESTAQFYLEGEPRSGRRKNSTYFAHGLHRYKGKFYPQLAKALLNLSSVGEGDWVVDPFGGSGTVALEANFIGINAISIDCNPVAAAVADAKTSLLHTNPAATREYLSNLVAISRRNPSASSDLLEEFASDVLPELESWFPVPVLTKLAHLLRSVRTSSDDPRLVRVGEVLVSDIVREVSQQDPRDLRIRRRAEPIEDAPALQLFSDRASTLLERLNQYWERARHHLPSPGRSVCVVGDSADADNFPSVTPRAVVSSPPYAAALPYVDTDRLSLAAVFGYSQQRRKALESVMIGSREVTSRERAAIERSLLEDPEKLELPESTLTFLLNYLDAVHADSNAGFRRRQAPAVLTRYFQGMGLVLKNLQRVLAPRSDLWLVLGDSRSVVSGHTWRIPTVDEVHAIAKGRGYEVAETIPITVTREDVVHARNAIVENRIVRLLSPA
jgi:DNA modification methylase